MVSINIEIKKKDLWLLTSIFVFMVGVGIVIAYNSGASPSVFGHSSEEIEISFNGDIKTLQQVVDEGGFGGGGNYKSGTIEAVANVANPTVTSVNVEFTPKSAICAANQVGRAGNWGHYLCSYSISGNSVTFTITCTGECANSYTYYNYLIVG